MTQPAAIKVLPEGREARGILPWVIAVMVYLCTLATAGGFGLRTAASTWTQDMARRATIQVSGDDQAARNRNTAAVMAVLRTVPSITQTRQLPDKEVIALLEPWLGPLATSEDIPVPTVIDVTFSSDAPDLTLLSQKLKETTPQAALDTHRQWLGQLSAFTHSVEWTANFVVILVALATMALVAFGVRAGLASHRPTIEILHLIGAEDSLIAREYQRRFFWHGLLGGLGGLALGLITIFVLGWLAQRAGQGLIASVNLSPVVWSALAVLPLFAGILTMVTAGFTVHRALREIL